MKLPRDLKGVELAKALKKLGNATTRQTGSHLRLMTHEKGEHHITIPKLDSLKLGTLHAILKDVAEHLKMSLGDLIDKL